MSPDSNPDANTTFGSLTTIVLVIEPVAPPNTHVTVNVTAYEPGTPGAVAIRLGHGGALTVADAALGENPGADQSQRIGEQSALFTDEGVVAATPVVIAATASMRKNALVTAGLLAGAPCSCRCPHGLAIANVALA